jgi:uncharacterized membrane protein
MEGVVSDGRIEKRRRWRRAGLGLGGLGVLAAVASLATMDVARSTAHWTVIALGGVALAIGTGLVLLNPASPSESKDPEPGLSRRDREQRARRSSLFMWGVQFVFALSIALPAIHRMAAGEARWANTVFALVVVMWAWLALMQIQGWDGGSKKARKYLEDEWTRVLRASAMTWGYVALLAGMSVVYAISLWRPDWTPVALALALAIGGAVPALRFAFMDKAADGADE